MGDEPRKRSRFDQAPEDAPARRSRFDRRSRSPDSRGAEPQRTRSPTGGDDVVGGAPKVDPAAAAAAAAARINASINAKKGVQHVDVPPIRQTASPAGNSPGSSTPAGEQKEVYTQDGDFIKDIEVNDLRNRYTLTKGSTQKMIKEKTGADVTTRGSYYPDKSMATATNPPLYLHVTSTTKEGLEKAIAEIDELMKQELPNLIDERRFRRQQREEQPVERDHLGRRKWPDEQIPIDLEPIPGFNLRAQVVGQGGSYVKHIQQETRTRVQIKGRGSGFIEHDTGRESDEQMYLHVHGPDAAEVQRAKEMCIDLLGHVRTSYDEFKEQRNQRSHSGGHHRGDYGHNNAGHGGGGGGGDPYAPPAQQGYNGNGQQPAYPAYPAYGTQGGGQPGYYSAPGYDNQSQVAPAQQYQAAGEAQQPQASVQDWINYYDAHPEADPYGYPGGYGIAMRQYYESQGQPVPGSEINGSHSQPPPPPPPAGAPGTDIPPPPPPPPPGT